MPRQYTISELAQRTGLSIHTLRYYEKEGVLRRVERTPGGRRLYSEASIGTVIGALCLKHAGLTLPQIKEFFDLTEQGIDTLPQRLSILNDARINLLDQQRKIAGHLEFVDLAISYSRGALRTASEGGDPEASHPFLTAEGVFNFPCERREDGSLAPHWPEELS